MLIPVLAVKSDRDVHTDSALIGFLICLFPLACQLMDWRDTGGAAVGASGIGTYFFFGGVLLLIGSIGEVS